MKLRWFRLGLFALGNGALSMAILAVAAWLTRQPLIFPSLGPTAFLLFYAPRAPAASPRNAICGHLIGISAGYLSLVIFGLTRAPSAMVAGVTLPWVGAASLSLGLTAGLMVWLKVAHAPAAATTLIVGLGLISRPLELAVLMAAVAGLVVQGLIINRLAGIPYPLWAPQRFPGHPHQHH